MERSTNAPVRALVAGTGFGCRIQVPALRGAGFHVAGLVGTDPRRTTERAAANGVPGAFTDLDMAITETGARLVLVSTPPSTHHEVTMAAIRRGCHVLCEKPFATNAAEAAEMLQAAQTAGVVHLVGHEFRFIPQRALIARSITQGLIGEPRFFSTIDYSAYVAQFASNLPDWWFDPSKGGGWLGASGSHIIDQVRNELGEVTAVSAALPQISIGSSDVEDSFAIRLRLANGIEGIVQQTGGAFGAPARLFRISGTEGSIWTEDGMVKLANKSTTYEIPVPPDLMLPAVEPGFDPRQKTPEWQRLTALELAPYTQLCRHMSALIRQHRPPCDVTPASFNDGFQSIRVIDAIRLSARQGGAQIDLN